MSSERVVYGSGPMEGQRDALITLIDWLICCGKLHGAFSLSRATREAHDIGHVLLGGDRVLVNWHEAKAFARIDPELFRLRDCQEAPDVQLRLREMLARCDR